MNFEINREVFLHYLLQIQKILPQKTFFPIYHSLKLEVQQNILFLEASNMNVSVRIKIEDHSLQVKQKGSILILGKYLIDIMKKINYNTVYLASMENKFLVIKTDYSEYKLKTIDLDNFPLNNFSFNNLNYFEIESILFKKIIKEINITVSKDKNKMILTGVNFNYCGNFLVVSATDSFHFSQKKIKLNLNYSDFNIVIPNKSLEELLKLLEQQKEGKLRIFIDESKFFLCNDYLFFQTSLLEGHYPLLPLIEKNNFPYFLKINKDNFLKTLERVSLFLPKESYLTNNQIYLHILKENKIQITSCSEEIGKALEELFLLEQFIDKEIITSFNVKYLEEILKVFLVKEVKIFYQNSFKPFLIISEEEPNLLYLIIPFVVN
ncbi:MAG: DNA polymerase III subunit beta [Vigna little leaf phytoplasma]|nr:DNA polymerase III subunit beta [Vigna little leaf phytoplasma]